MPNTPEESSRSAVDTKELKKHITNECKKAEQKILEKIPGMEETLKKLMERNIKLEKDLGQFLNLRDLIGRVLPQDRHLICIKTCIRFNEEWESSISAY